MAKQPVAQPAAKPAAQQGAQQPLVQQQPEAQISDATKAMFATLMIPDTKPFRPKKPAMEDITAGRGGRDLKYMEKLQKHAVRSFSTFLYKDEVVKLRQPLYASICPEVDNTPKNAAASGTAWRPTSIMDPLDMDHCISALTHSESYEGAVELWNLDPMKTSAFDIDSSGMRDPTWIKLDVLSGHWSEEVLASSHAVEGKQRFFFPGTPLSFVKEVTLLQTQTKTSNGATLSEMPVSGGHSLVWSFYNALDAALDAGNTRLLGFYREVSLQVSVRLRLNPTANDLGLDRLAMADQLRVKYLGHGAQSFTFLGTDVFFLPVVTTKTEKAPADSGATHLLSKPKLVDLLAALCVTYKGKPIDRNLAHAMLAAQTFSLDRHCRAAVVLLERVGPRGFEDHTRVMRRCHKVSKNSSGGEDQCMAFKFAVECMAVSLLTGDLQDEGNFTVKVVAGTGKSDPGCAHVTLI